LVAVDRAFWIALRQAWTDWSSSLVRDRPPSSPGTAEMVFHCSWSVCASPALPSITAKLGHADATFHQHLDQLAPCGAASLAGNAQINHHGLAVGAGPLIGSLTFASACTTNASQGFRGIPEEG